MADGSLRTAALLATGEELVRGAVADAHAAWLARRLRSAGVEVVEIRVVGDGLEAIRAAVSELSRRADLLLVTGGLGPTPDDRTRDAMAAAAEVPLERDPAAAALVQRCFARLGRGPSASNVRQTLLPRGARVIENPAGSAPGFELTLGRARVVVLPGVPHELHAMVEQSVLPLVKAGAAGPPIAERFLQVSGLPESVLGERIESFLRAPGPPLVSETVRDGVVTLCASDRDDEAGRARLEQCVAGLKAALGAHVFSERDESLAEHVVERLRARGETVAVAESCTGGLVAAALTDVPGSSDALIEACVTYANAAKSRTLAVPEELLRRAGAVSEEVARAMAEGVRARASATWGIAVTGIAGPAGGSDAKPVGLIHLAVAGPAGTSHLRRQFPGDRAAVRRFAVVAALELLRRSLEAPARPAGGRGES
jgi:nicotinamide-nucleotide amidase